MFNRVFIHLIFILFIFSAICSAETIVIKKDGTVIENKTFFNKDGEKFIDIQASDVTIRNCTFEQEVNEITNPPDKPVIVSRLIVARTGDERIIKNLIIENCKFKGASAQIIIRDTVDSVIRNCLFKDNWSDPKGGHGDGISSARNKRLKIHNNIFDNIVGTGCIKLGDDDDLIECFNNFFLNCGGGRSKLWVKSTTDSVKEVHVYNETIYKCADGARGFFENSNTVYFDHLLFVDTPRRLWNKGIFSSNNAYFNSEIRNDEANPKILSENPIKIVEHQGQVYFLNTNEEFGHQISDVIPDPVDPPDTQPTDPTSYLIIEVPEPGKFKLYIEKIE